MIIRPIVVGAHADGEDRHALQFAVALSSLTDAPLELIGTYWFDHAPGRRIRKSIEERFRRQLQDVLEQEHLDGSACGDLHVVAAAGTTVAVLQEAAKRVRASLIVVAAERDGQDGSGTPGSLAEQVLDGAPCPVAVVPSDHETLDHRFDRIGVAFIDTPEGRAALRGGVRIARHTGATLVAYTAKEGLSAAAADHARDALERALAACADGAPAEARVLDDGVSALVGETADLDLMLAGSRRYGPPGSTVLGRASRELIRRSSCPLIVVPRDVESPLQDLFDRSHALAR